MELTGIVPAASGGAASPPCAIKLHGVPVTDIFIAQSVGGQITDLQPRKLPLELIKGHPGSIRFFLK